MSERPIPDDLMALARTLRVGVIWESNASVELIARTLLKVQTEERERCAKIAEGDSAAFDFQTALGDHNDMSCGFHSGRLAAAKYIRESAQ